MSALPFFYEEKSMGEWRPVLSAEKPTVKKGRILHATGVGPEIRALSQIEPWMKKLTLDEIRELLSPDGRFCAAQRRSQQSAVSAE